MYFPCKSYVERGAKIVEENLIITLEIDKKNKNIYIGEESSTGATYHYKDINDLANNIKSYLKNYYSKDFKIQPKAR